MSEAVPRPLKGRRILVTREESKTSVFARMLEERGASVLSIPLIRFVDPDSWEALDQALLNIGRFQILLFTSANAVERFFDRLHRIAPGGKLPGTISIAAVGPKTAQAVARHGAEVSCIADSFRAEGLLQKLSGEKVARAEILFPRAQEAREILIEELERRGARVTLATVYRTLPVDESREPLHSALASGELDVVTFTSASAVRHFIDIADDSDLASRMRGVAVACLGEITAQAARATGLAPAIVSERSTLEDFADAIAGHFAVAGETR